MPELPEVETIRLGLSKKIVGLTISNVQVLNPRTFQSSVKASELRGKKVLKVWRRAKILGIDLSPAVTLLIHLKMTGQLIYVVKTDQGKGKRLIGGHPTSDMRDQMPNKSTRVIFEFSDRSKLYFNDQRKFGWIKLSEKLKVQSEKFMKDLGPEPLEKNFTWQILKQKLLRHKNWPVKVALMDQKAIAGVGNIYASETCFNGKIDPRTKVSQLTDQQFQGLHRGVIKAFKDAIKHGGSTLAHFVNSEGHKGYFLDYAYVYGRDGEKCKKCGSIIHKLQLGGRGTYFCERCQS